VPKDSGDLAVVVGLVEPDASAVVQLEPGGYASTFRIDRGDETFVLKIVDPAKAEETRIEREIAALRRVSDPHVVRFLDSGLQSSGGVDYHWIRMEFVPGQTLAARMTGESPPTQTEALEILSHLLEGASAIWAQDTAHRDLSPRNIILRTGGVPTIVDLGLARHVDDATYTILPSPGTPGWMSPEQVGLVPERGDWRSDQFVLGAIAYYLVTGTPPFSQPNLWDRWRAPANTDPTPVLAANPAIHPEVAAMIETMMQKHPHRRFLRVEALLSEVARVSALAVVEPSASLGGPGFYFAIGNVKNYATATFLASTSCDGLVMDIQAGARVPEFVGIAAGCGMSSAIDPVTFYARSALEARPAHYLSLPFGSDPQLDAPSPDGRADRCRSVLDAEIASRPTIAIAPYYYAGPGEGSWIAESLECSAEFASLMGERGSEGQSDVWRAVSIDESWLEVPAQRDELLSMLTGAEDRTFYVLVRTRQASFAPIAHQPTLAGFRDLIETLQGAGSRVVAANRDVSGLLLCAIGAYGWSTGVAAKLMNGRSHPETSGGVPGRAKDHIYVPQLLNLIRVDQFALWASTHPELLGLVTPEANALLEANSDLDELTSEQRVLLLQHNLRAQGHQVRALRSQTGVTRADTMLGWIESARRAYEVLPKSARTAERGAHLTAWEAVAQR